MNTSNTATNASRYFDIHGDDDVFMRLTEPDDAQWSWALYPPAFFLHGLRIPQGQEGAFAIGKLDTHPEAEESGIYMMEYGDVYEAAKRNRPERWSGPTRNWKPIAVVHLNPDKTTDNLEGKTQLRKAA